MFPTLGCARLNFAVMHLLLAQLRRQALLGEALEQSALVFEKVHQVADDA